jgi:hypothetical protein
MIAEVDVLRAIDPIDEFRRESVLNQARIARAMTAYDVPWFITLCHERYPPRADKIRIENWLRNRVLADPTTHLAMRTGAAACITTLSEQLWFPGDWEGHVTMIVAEEGAIWEAIKLLRFSKHWTQERQCVCWRMTNGTSHDIGPLARRLGAQETKHWEIRWARS